MNRYYDVCIVGGGASGLAASVYIKQKNSDISVAVLERLSRVGKKLITTGNGRCNITNRDESLTHFHGENASFSDYAITKYSNNELESFFESIGVPFYYDETGRGYPYSLQASSVVDALRFSAENFGVDIYTDTKLTDIETKNNIYDLITENTKFSAKSVVIAAGLYSGGVRLGCDGSVLRLLKSKGIDVVKTTPAIVQIKTENQIVKQLKGIKVNAKATLIIDKKTVRSEAGEVLFCDYGLSGPPILQIAREVERSGSNKTVCLDLLPDMSMEEVIKTLLILKNNIGYRNLDEYLSGLLNKRLGQVIIKSAALKLSQSVSKLSENEIKLIARVIKCFEFKVLSTTGFDNSQVTAGGFDTSFFNDRTMMSKKYANLYAIGEILDIDGDCGGYNLHFAFSSAFCAADSIVKEYKNDKT